jgi:UDP-GlcNAc:undecaprenyl-phosphate/decaprenyl-phosphate GlcNAc-1-phosphate transferase
MGDAGSLFIGVVVSGLSLIGGWPYSGGVASVLLFPVLILLVPIFDTAFVTLARLFAGRSISTGGRDHTSHRLVALGLSERRAVALLYAVAVLAGTVAFFGYRQGLSSGGVLAALLGLGVLIFGVFLGRLRIYEESALPQGPGTAMVTLIADFPYKRQVATVLNDLTLIIVAYYSAYLLRFEAGFAEAQPLLIRSLPIVIACQVGAFASFRVYQGVWRYTSVSDLMTMSKAATAGVVASVLVLLFAFRFEGYSRTVFLLDWLLLVLLVSASRLSFRTLSELLHGAPADVQRVIVYGAGDGGVMVLREIRSNRALRREVVGFLDDDRSKRRATVQGVPVFGGLDRLEDAVMAQRAQEVIVSSAKVDGSRIAEIAARCEALGVAVVRSSFRLD